MLCSEPSLLKLINAHTTNSNPIPASVVIICRKNTRTIPVSGWYLVQLRGGRSTGSQSCMLSICCLSQYAHIVTRHSNCQQLVSAIQSTIISLVYVMLLIWDGLHDQDYCILCIWIGASSYPYTPIYAHPILSAGPGIASYLAIPGPLTLYVWDVGL